MLFNLDFANNTILSCFFFLFFFLIIVLYFLILGIPTKEAKAEMETHPVIKEIAISQCSI